MGEGFEAQEKSILLLSLFLGGGGGVDGEGGDSKED